MAWVALVAAGLSELFVVLAIKRVADNRRKLTAYVFLIAALGTSFYLLKLAMLDISMGTAYAVWTGIGTIGSAVLGMLAFGESRSVKRLFYIGLILASTIGLKLIS